MVSLVSYLFHRLTEKHGIKTLRELFANQRRLTNAKKMPSTLQDPQLLEVPMEEVSSESTSDDFKTTFEEFFFKEALSNLLAEQKQKEKLNQLLLKKHKRDAGKKKDFKTSKIFKIFQTKPWLHVDEWKVKASGVVSDSESELESASTLETKQKLDILSEDSPWLFVEDDEKGTRVVLKKLPTLRVPIRLFEMLYPYQREGLEWMAELRLKRTGGILGDEMGLGKTMQTLTFIFCLMDSKEIKNCLIVCPNAIIDATWKKEAKKLLCFFGGQKCSIQVCFVHSKLPPKQRNAIFKKAKNCSSEKPHFVVTTYSQFQNKALPTGLMKFKKNFDYVCLDEGHKVKNKKSNTSVNVTKIITSNTRVMVLSGTPLLNRMEELYRLLKLCTGEEVVGKEEDFKQKYIKPIEAARQKSACTYILQKGEEVLRELKEMILPYFLKRQRKDYLSDTVPSNHQFDIWLKLSQKQRALYKTTTDTILSNMQDTAPKNVLPYITQLRMICGHPLMEHKGNVLERCTAIGVDRVISLSPKVEFLKDITVQWIEEGRRILIFCHHQELLDILEFVLDNLEGANACRIDGKTSAKKLEYLVNHFNSDISVFNVMLMSTQVGSEGLNLTGASKAIVFEPVWTQAASDQAVARISRPGQLFECESLFLIAAGTVEEKMVGKQIYKGTLDRTVLGEETRCTGSASFSRLYNKKELSKLFELAPEGCCETVDRMKESGDFKDGQGLRKCSVNKNHSSVIGISQRSILYTVSSSSKKGRMEEESVVQSAPSKRTRVSHHGEHSDGAAEELVGCDEIAICSNSEGQIDEPVELETATKSVNSDYGEHAFAESEDRGFVTERDGRDLARSTNMVV